MILNEDEAPYTPPSQAAWMLNADFDGYPQVAVSSNVNSFTLSGFIMAARFSNGCDCYITSGITTPVTKGINLSNLIAGSIWFPVPP
jgi:hypothetical protein